MPAADKRSEKTVSYRPSDRERAFLAQIAETPSAGTEFAVEAFHAVYRAELARLCGQFSAPELSLFVDLMNSCLLTPGFLGHHLPADVHDGIRLEGLAEKWQIGGPALETKLADLHPFSVAALEVWAKAFWIEGGEDLAGYVAKLAKKQEEKKKK